MCYGYHGDGDGGGGDDGGTDNDVDEEDGDNDAMIMVRMMATFIGQRGRRRIGFALQVLWSML